jgi:hypothetical protein
MMKLSIFNPNRLAEVHFSLGRHTADPVGETVVPPLDEVLLFHYRYLGFEQTHLRHQQLRAGLGERDCVKAGDTNTLGLPKSPVIVQIGISWVGRPRLIQYGGSTRLLLPCAFVGNPTLLALPPPQGDQSDERG